MDKKTTGLLRTALLATTTAALTACGGGGSDSGDGLPTSGSYAISTSSGALLTTELSDSIDMANWAYGFGYDVGTSFASAGSAGAARQGRASALHALLERATAGKRIASASRQVTASSTDTMNCGLSGSTRVSVVDQNANNAYDAGDSVTMVFSACRDGDGTQLDGTIALTYNSAIRHDAGTGAFSMDVTSRFTRLTLTTLSTGAAGMLDGDARIVSNYSSATVGQDTLTASSFSASLLNSGIVTGSRTFRQLSWSIDTDSAGTAWASLVTELSSEVLGGRSVVITTPTALRTLAADAYPSVGAVKVTGASGASMTLTALSASQVRRDIDTNGDGLAESSTVLGWSNILGSN